MSCLKTNISILYCCNCWYNYECIFVIVPWGTLIGIKILYCIVLSFEEKRSYEKVHIKYCKAMLGIKNLAKKSCWFVHFNKKKVKKKKSWIDTEFKDLKKTVLNLGSEVKKQPFNSQLELIILHIVKNWKRRLKIKNINIRRDCMKNFWTGKKQIQNNTGKF